MTTDPVFPDPVEMWRVVNPALPTADPVDFDTKTGALELIDQLIDQGHRQAFTYPIVVHPAGEPPC